MMRRFLTAFSLVTLLLACAAPAFVAGLVTPAHAATDFVVLGDEGISIEKESTIVGGDVGANRASAGPFLSHGVEVSLDKQVRLLDPTSRVLGHRVYLDQDVQVFDVHTNALSGPGTVGGQIVSPLALPLVTLPAIPPVTPGSQDLTVPQQGSLSLAAGSYGTLTVGKEATVTLTGGLYHFAAWALDKQVRVQMTAPTEIRIAGRLAIDKEAVLGPAPGTSLTAADILLLVTGVNGTTGALDATPKAADLGKQSTVRAKLYIPHGTLRLDKESQVTGALLAKWVAIGKQGQLTFEGGFGLGQPPPSLPTITGFTPTSGTVGMVVTITGTNFTAGGAGATTVKFNGKLAILTTLTATSLTTTVPQGATTGLITVTTPGGTASSTQTFTVTTTQDFSLTVAPVALSVVQGRPITTQVQLANAGSNPVTGFVALAATGLPTGMTGAFTPSQIAGGQVATLTLNSGTAPTGLATITISATAVIEGQTIVRQSPLTVTVLAAGGTTLAGRILATKDDAPISGARVKIGSLIVTTDASGNFLFTNAPAGSQVLLIDGPSALYPGDLPVQMTIQPGIANVLPYPVFLHEVSQNYIPIVPGAQTIVAPSDVPDFTMIIPAGTTITGWDGQPNTRVSITPVPVDRIPVPPPPAALQVKQTYMFNFGKPGGGYPSRPIPILMPNDLRAAPGERVDFWYFDESPTADPNSNQWKMYGQGTISADGRQAIPDPGVGQPKFCCGISFIARLQAAALAFFKALFGADPVMLQTGMFSLEQTDLVLPGLIPIVIRRAYHSQDPGDPPSFSPPARELVNSNAFGFNTTLMDYDDRLEGTGTGQTVTYTSGFNRARFSLQTDGTYRDNRTPILAGMIGRRNQDGSSTMRDKSGTVRAFGADGWLRSITDRTGNTVTIVRTGSQIQQIIEPGGRALTFQYGSGGVSQITDPIGRTVTYTYETSPFGGQQLRSVQNPAVGTTTYTYDGRFNLLTITDARGITYLTNTYVTTTDSTRRPLDPAVETQTLADGSVTRFDYVVTNRTVTQTTVTDPRGNKTAHRFNGRNHEVATVDAVGQQTRTTRDFTTNQVTETRDPLNRLTKFTYDLAGNVNSILDPQQNPTLFEYEANFNRVTKITDALNQPTRFTYDPNTGNLLTTIDPLTHATSITYNQFGQPISVTDALNHTTTFEYDEVGNLIATVDPLGNRTLRFYDAVSRLIAIVDARGKGTQFTYDNLNRVTQIQDAINGLTSFTYDPNGNLLTVTDAKNQVTTYTYDNMDRLAIRKDALNRTESYQYDLAGNLTQFTDRKNQVATFQYDALNRRTQATYPDATTTFAYDTVGRLTKASDTAPGAGNIDFGYDILDRLIQETTPQGTVAYQYDVLGRRTQMTANGQQPTTYQYDPASRLTQVAQGSLAVGLGYDNANRRTSLGYSNGTTTSYAYDLSSRLTGITHNGPAGIIEALTYTYDAAGNRFSAARANGTASLLPSAVASAAYDAANQQTSFGGATLTYDNNGNLTNDGMNTYQWDARNRLIQITSGVNGLFNYDALGRRTNKTVNGVANQFAYDGNDIAAEIGGGAVGANYLRSLNIDEPFIRQSGTGNEHYHADALGSSLALSNAQGVSAVAYTYEPFGKTTVTGMTANAVQYTGRENDGTGLYYYRARYYSPKTDRFLSEDPAAITWAILARQALRTVEAGDFEDFVRDQDDRLGVPYSDTYTNSVPLRLDPQMYAYAYNTPTIYTDPTGEFVPQLAGCLIGAGISLGSDVLGERKPSLLNAGLGCLAGAGVGHLISITRILPIGKGIEIVFSKNFRVGWHRFNLGGNPVNRPHWHSRPGIGRHRPWQ